MLRTFIKPMVCVLAGLVAMTSLAITTVAVAQERGWLGIRGETVTQDLVAQMRLSVPFGVLVSMVRDYGPAKDAGLRPGHVIFSVDGQPMQDLAALADFLKTKKVGDKIALGTLQNGQLKTIQVVLGSRSQRRKANPKVSQASTAPELMLETGGHMAVIWMMEFTPDGDHIISASSDKVVRVWNWKTGQTVRQFRGQVGPGSMGKPYALALSPDTRWLAVAGWMHKDCGPRCGSVRFYDYETGQLVERVEAHKNVIHNVKFSSDGRWMVTASADKTSIIWNVETRRPVATLKGHTQNVYHAVFTPDDQNVVTAAYDGLIKIWDRKSGEEVATLKGHDGPIRALALSPDGRTLATGGRGQKLRFWNLENRTQIAKPVALKCAPGAMVFSNDGTRLVMTSGIGRCGYQQHVYDVASRKLLRTYKGHGNTTYAAARHPGGELIATGDFLGAIHIWHIDTAKPEQVLAGIGKSLWATAFSADSSTIAWGFSSRYTSNNVRGPLQYTLKLPVNGARLGRPQKLDPEQSAVFLRGFTKAGDVSIKHTSGGRKGLTRYDGALEMRVGGKVVATHHRGKSDGFRHRSYAVSPDGQRIISGGNNGIILHYGRNGKVLGRYQGHNSEVWSLTPSPDSRYLVSGSADQTVRLFNLKTRELVVSLFHAPDGEWVMWTPQGFYTGSPGAGTLVGWQINNGPDQEADYVYGEQYRRTLRRHDIVERSIALASAKAATQEAFPVGFDLGRLLSSRPPQMALMTPEQNSTAFGGSTRVTVRVDSAQAPIDKFEVYVNGRKVSADQLPVPTTHPKPPKGWRVYAFDVPLFQGPNDVSIVASNAFGTTPIDANVLRVRHTGEGALDTRGTLHIVAIGVDRYPGLGKTCSGPDGRSVTCDLRFAGKDARVFAETMAREMGQRHQRTVTDILVNNPGDGEKAPTRKNIIAVMDRISAANPNDTVVIFLAGHGEQGLDGKYYFLPTDIRRDGMQSVGKGENILPWSNIQGALTTALGRRLLFVDACQSGTANAQRAANDQLLSDARAEKFVAFTATAPEQLAQERPDIGHGLFTYALVEGLKGEALNEQERAIRVYGLGGFLSRTVRRMSNGQQTPEFYSGHGDIVLVRK